MALIHTPAGAVFSARPLAAALGKASSYTLVRDPDLQIFRLVLQAGQSLHRHQVPERMVIQCIEGRFLFETMGRQLAMAPGDFCHIAVGEPHAVHAQEAASALVMLFAPHPTPTPTENPR